MTAPFVIAHRGASHDANENAASAILEARRLGVEAIEIDVHAAKDGAIVVHHDEDLLRACGDSRRIADLRRDELEALRQAFGDERGIRRAPEPILFLDDAIALAAPIPLVVEIKRGSPDLAALTRAVVSRLEPDRASHRIISFESEVVTLALSLFDPARIGLIRNTEYGDDGWRDLLGPECGLAVLSRRIVTAERIDALLAARRDCFVYALDDEESVRRFARLGAAGIISNRPGVAIAALRTSR